MLQIYSFEKKRNRNRNYTKNIIEMLQPPTLIIKNYTKIQPVFTLKGATMDFTKKKKRIYNNTEVKEKERKNIRK